MEITNPSGKMRLIVLLPECLAGDTELAHHINRMANRHARDVLYFPMLEDKTDPLSVSRRMTTMTAATAGEDITVSSRWISRRNWLKTLQEVYQPGDMLVCMAEQSVKTGFMQAMSMQEYLQSVVQIPCQAVSGFYHPVHDNARQWLFPVVIWTVALAIVIGFTVMEFNIDQSLHGVTRIILLLLAVGLELGILTFWTSLPRI